MAAQLGKVCETQSNSQAVFWVVFVWLFFFFSNIPKSETLNKEDCSETSPFERMGSLALKNWWAIAGAVQDSFLLSGQIGKF